MDGYPPGTLDRNAPLLVASGLNSKPGDLQLQGDLRERGVHIRSEFAPLDNREAEVLEDFFRDVDARARSWTAFEREETYRLRINTVGRSYVLPPRRAELPEAHEPLDANPVLHSPFSPLSPSSELYPDGHINGQWIKKHQDLVPSIFATFYTLSNERTSMTLQDNRLKADINDIKTALAKSGYKTRLAVILLGESDSDEPPLSVEDMSERLERIRRGTGLDPKSIFFVHPRDSPAELKRAADHVLSMLYLTCVEYYRDMGRHARKKRSRGVAPQPTIPPTSGTSQTLSLPDWNFRYDFKTGMFAEFRLELDTALKSFEQAYDTLLGPDVLDIIPSWNPRWNEARMLTDIISIRCVRLHIWMGQTSLAVRRWQAHRDRVSDLVDRRGRGTNNYGWQAWEARWAMVMANLMERIEIPSLEPAAMTLFHQPERAVANERLQPWELLHHTGYWYRIAARHLSVRRALALTIPEEDRQPLDSSPVAQVASKSYTYDTYMCPEPYEEYPLSGTGVNHAQLIIDCLITAGTQYQSRNQLRIAAELSMECAREMATLGSWREMVATLRPLWEDVSFRSEGWYDIAEDLCWLMRRAAAETGRTEIVVAIDWELMNKKFTRRPHWVYDVSKSLEGVTAASKTSASLSDAESSSFISASFTFRHKQSRAGQVTTAQIALTSEAFPDSVPVTLSSIRVDFTGSLKPIVLEHEQAEQRPEDKLHVTPLSLTEDFTHGADDEFPSRLKGHSDLTLHPGQTRVFEVAIPLRESGDASASSMTLSYRTEAYNLDYSLHFRETDEVVGWFVNGSSKPRHARQDARALHIQPRPPKLEVKLIEPLDQYYANEVIELRIEILNAEDEAANVKIDAHLLGKDAPSFKIRAGDEEQTADETAEESTITGLSLGTMTSTSSLSFVLTIDPIEIPATYDLNLRALYHLESDAATPITQILPFQLNVVGAFEANYDLMPRLHSDPWPSLFDYEGVLTLDDSDAAHANAKGFSQRWCLVCHYASFAHEDLKVVGVDITVLSCVGGAKYDVVERPVMPEEGIIIAPRTMHEAQFDLTAQKFSLDDRQPVSLDLAFIIRWQRHGTGDDSAAAKTNTTTMLVGKYVVLGIEPRVLASAYHTAASDGGQGLTNLDVTIENPSNHFLTFGLAMEPSDEFAFSGPKQTTLHLLPMSRRTTTYRLLPQVGNVFVRPGLVVRDKYFQKTLRIIPTEGMKIDKDGLLIWVPGESGDEEESEVETSVDES